MKKNQGSVSALILGILMVLIVISLTISNITTNAMVQSRREREAVVNFEAAQAGLEFEETEVRDFYDEHEYLDILLHITSDEYKNRTKNLFSYAFFIPAPAPQKAGSPSGPTLPNDSSRSGWVTSVSIIQGRVRSVRSFIYLKDLSIWNNAIFAGSGQAGRTINGNVDIRGSMHLLGDGEAYRDLNGNGQWDDSEEYTDSNRNGVWDPGEDFVDANGDGTWNVAEPYQDSNFDGVYEPPLVNTDLNSEFAGSAQMGNNYDRMVPILVDTVDPIPVYNGQASLAAELRVKHGMFALSGQATAGQPDPGDPTQKWSIDGAYVSDGFTGTRGETAVYSDNGANKAYDAHGFKFKFPYIDGIIAEPYEVDGTTYINQRTFLDGYGLNIPAGTINDNTPAFSYGPDIHGNAIRWTPTADRHGPSLLEIQGVIRVDGDLHLGTSKAMVRYDGRGTIYTTGNFALHSDFVPKAGLRFPSDTSVGIIAAKNMLLADSADAQLRLSGAFYAQGAVQCTKQNEIAGTIVANFYDFGNQIPSIFQVPSLLDHMPPHMPGDESVISIKEISWRERRPWIIQKT